MMDRKTMIGLAAVAGIALLLSMRKTADRAAVGSSGALVGAASAASNWAGSPIVITTSTKPQPVADRTAVTPPPAPAQPAGAGGGTGGGGAVFGAGPSSSGFVGIKDGRRVYSDGSSAALTDNELDLYNRGILGTHYGAYTTPPAAAPAAAPAPSGAPKPVWGAS